MTTRSHTAGDTMDCAAFEERLPAWLEGQLDDEGRTAMERHNADCATCAALVSDLDALVQSARALPVLSPARDLWSGIEARLTAPVIPLQGHREDAGSPAARPNTPNMPNEAARFAQPKSSRGAPSMRWFAVAATVLVAVTSGVTWTVARARFEQPASPAVTVPTVASAPAAAPVTASVAAPAAAQPTVASAEQPATSGTTAPSSTSGNGARNAASPREVVTLQAASMQDIDRIYEREIAALRQIVNQRFASLDTATVNVLRQNLETIDRAIADSRRALARDPNSALLSTELDRTLDAKLALMRRVALL